MNRLKMEMSDESGDDSSGEYMCMNVTSINKVSEPCLVEVSIEGKSVKMEIDCGSAVSVMGIITYITLFNQPLHKSNRKLIVVDGGNLKVFGETKVTVNFKNIIKSVSLVIIDNSEANNNHRFIPLLGREWLDVFIPNWRDTFQTSINVHNVSINDQVSCLSDIESKFSNVFKKDFSTPILGYEAELVLKDDKPIFKRAYEVPYRLRERVCEYLDKLENENVITPVKTSEWASPVIVLIKKNNQIRLVVDCKVSINKLIIPNTYPLPVAQDLFARLSGCKVFCALDLEGAYTQLSLSKKSRRFMVINTIKGLYIHLFVAIGNVITNAHRNQLKISKAETPTMNVMVPVTSTKRNRVVTVAEEEASTTSGSFQPEQTNSKPPSDPEAILPALRRSSRTKRRKVNEDFVYM
ncbi:uncharacterized protein K02A2.6-like [Aedes albopictus]|uniref:Reverse transcriptase domain-containing protein n=1 Tax=Aedes albopictus TaxID=7160 RepID=A0ABM1XYB3_AEDAL